MGDYNSSMKDIQKYKGIYRDETGTVDICIENDFRDLFVEIDGVKFSGSEFSDFTILEKALYSEDRLKRFTFLQTQIYNSDRFLETLCHFSIEITMPQIILDLQTKAVFPINIKFEYVLGKPRPEQNRGIESEEGRITMILNDETFSAKGDVMEVIFDQLYNQFKGRYVFRNCYGCMFGDYSVYGQSFWGTMLCFVNQKEEYKKVKSKQDYLALTGDIQQVQETYCCDSYEIRTKGAGYRG